jgi:hypothetical protein
MGALGDAVQRMVRLERPHQILNDLIGKATLRGNASQHNILWIGYGCGCASLLYDQWGIRLSVSRQADLSSWPRNRVTGNREQPSPTLPSFRP